MIDLQPIGGAMYLDQARVLTIARPRFERRTLGELAPTSWDRIYFYVLALEIEYPIILAEFTAVNMIHFDTPLARDGLNLFAVPEPIYVMITLHRNCYGLDLLTQRCTIAWRRTTSVITAIAAAGFTAFCLRGSMLVPCEVLFWGIGPSVVLMIVSRYTKRRLAECLFGHSLLSELLIHDGVADYSLPSLAKIDTRAINLEPDLNDPHMRDRLGRQLKQANRVVVACPQDRHAKWAVALRGADIRTRLLTPDINCLRPLYCDRFRNDTPLVVSGGPLYMPNRALKRGLDLDDALVALCVKLDSAGPVFFAQCWLGRGNRLFVVCKFRSMTAGHV